MAASGDDLARELQAALVPLTSVTAGFTDLASQILPFVAALAPGEIWLFKDALLNLQATIGQALLPILEQLTAVFGEASGVLGPAMRELAPLVQKAAEVITALFIPNLQLMSAAIALFMPVLEQLVELDRAFNDALKVATVGLTALLEVLKKGTTFGDALAVVSKAFVDTVKEVIKALVLLAAMLVKFFGGDLGMLIQKLTAAAPVKEVNRAPQDAAIKSFQQISDDIVRGAFIANKGAPEKTQDDFLKELVKGLEDVNAGRKTVESIIREARDGIVTKLGTLPGEIGDAFNKVWDKIKEWLNNKLPGGNPFG